MKKMSKRKQCTKCGRKLPATLQYFCRDRTRESGLNPWCKVCVSAHCAAWAAANPDKKRATAAVYYSANRETIIARAAAWYVANPDKVKSRSAAYYAANSEKIRANVAKWKAANPIYDTWKDMIRRCTNPKTDRWKCYGGATPPVKVCSRWSDPDHGYDNFVADMGPKPTPRHSLGRFLDLGNYELGNCSWQTRKEQGAERTKKHELLQKAA
jgi:hypothetical protein